MKTIDKLNGKAIAFTSDRGMDGEVFREFNKFEEIVKIAHLMGYQWLDRDSMETHDNELSYECLEDTEACLRFSNHSGLKIMLIDGDETPTHTASEILEELGRDPRKDKVVNRIIINSTKVDIIGIDDNLTMYKERIAELVGCNVDDITFTTTDAHTEEQKSFFDEREKVIWGSSNAKSKRGGLLDEK